MFADDFEEFRARSYSGGFLLFAVDGRRSTSAPSSCSEPAATESDATGSDVRVRVSETDALPGRIRERCHSDEMPTETFIHVVQGKYRKRREDIWLL